MNERMIEPGLLNSGEGTILETLGSALPFAGRMKMKARLAIGTLTANTAMACELITEGVPRADKNYQERMRYLTGKIVYRSVQEYPELFRPEIILEEL